MSKVSDVANAIYEAKQWQRAVDAQATQMAQLLVGRLRHVKDWDDETLKALKKELAQFNMRTGEWQP